MSTIFLMKNNQMHYFPNFNFWLGILSVSGSSSAHQQEFSNCTFSIGTCHTDFEDSLQAESGWNIPTLFEGCLQNLYEICYNARSHERKMYVNVCLIRCHPNNWLKLTKFGSWLN